MAILDYVKINRNFCPGKSSAKSCNLGAKTGKKKLAENK